MSTINDKPSLNLGQALPSLDPWDLDDLSLSDASSSSQLPPAGHPSMYYGVNPYMGNEDNGRVLSTPVSCDALRVTVHGVAASLLLDELGGGALLEGMHRYYYDRVYKLGIGGELLQHSERQEMGVCVNLMGKALDALRVLWNVSSDSELCRRLLRYVHASGGRLEATRWDGALDDVSAEGPGVVDLDEVAACVERQELTGRCHVDSLETHRNGGFTESQWLSGWAITLGRRESDRYMRIYDKRVEQAVKRHVPLSELPAHWVRVELELKGAHAQAAFEYACQVVTLSEWLPGVVRDFVEFRSPTADSNKRRWPVASWWLALCGSTREKLHVVSRLAVTSVEARLEWYQRQVAPTVAVLQSLPGSSEWFRKVHQAGEGRASPELVAAARVYRRVSLGVPV